MRNLYQKNNPARHNLRPDDEPIYAEPVVTLHALQNFLQDAIAVEHSTIPPYLCALYSIKDGTNTKAAEMIRGIVMEEMLHMIQAANILSAIGGTPQINLKTFNPKYPGPLPYSDSMVTLNLRKFSRTAIETFLQIEKPAAPGARPQQGNYYTIGQFYQAVEDGLEYVDKKTSDGIFNGDKRLQMTGEHYFGGGGQLIPVYTLADAMLAIQEIIGQGEGIDGTIEDSDYKLFGGQKEYAHYFRFNEIYLARQYTMNDTPKSGPTGERLSLDWFAVHNMKLNPKLSDYVAGTNEQEMAIEFNKIYAELLLKIESACRCYVPEEKRSMLEEGVAGMYKLKYLAIELMKIPCGDEGFTCGPSFEYIERYKKTI